MEEENTNYNDDKNANKTLYIQNLNEKVRIDDMKQSLLEVFEQVGNVLNVHVKKNIRMRGQAFIVFDNIENAMSAKKQLNNQDLFGKKMKIMYAKQKSYQVEQLENPNWVKPEKPANPLSIKEQLDKKREETRKIKEKYRQVQNNDNNNQNNDVQDKIKTQKIVVKKQNLQPHHTLFIEGLTSEIKEYHLIQAFQRYEGFKEVRMIPVKKVAFVEYEDEYKAGVAMNDLNGIEMENTILSVNYANK